MNTSDDPVGRVPVIAVIGGGASGTLATICLLREAAARRLPLRVALIDRLLGLDTDDRGALRDASGRPASDIFTLGPTLRGHWYETTSIPEIRSQAAALPRHLLTMQAHAGPSSAA